MHRAESLLARMYSHVLVVRIMKDIIYFYLVYRNVSKYEFITSLRVLFAPSYIFLRCKHAT